MTWRGRGVHRQSVRIGIKNGKRTPLIQIRMWTLAGRVP